MFVHMRGHVNFWLARAA